MPVTENAGIAALTCEVAPLATRALLAGNAALIRRNLDTNSIRAVRQRHCIDGRAAGKRQMGRRRPTIIGELA